ncbi:unnamed protein product [Caenorhabditis nigoni]
MKSMKISLFTLHFWCMAQDWTLTVLIIPVFNFPTVSGYGMGLLGWLDVPMVYQFYLLLTLIIDQTIEVQNVLKKIPNLSPEIDRNRIFVLSNNMEFALGLFLSVAVLMALQALIFAGMIYWKLSFSTFGISANTMKLQRKILRAISIQITIFMVTIQIPFGYLSFSIMTDYYNQLGNNMVFILSGIHGISHTLVMLYVHKPYREACNEIFCCKENTWQKEQSGNESKVFQKNRVTLTYNLNKV